jgi:hypothetical protein
VKMKTHVAEDELTAISPFVRSLFSLKNALAFPPRIKGTVKMGERERGKSHLF